MSNFRNIATVTATLRQILTEAVVADVNGSTVTIARPDDPAGAVQAARVNIYLYQVTSNAALRNTDLPTRNSDGQLVRRPRTALDLHYILSFYGDENLLVPQRLLGSVIRTLHAQPYLARQKILETVQANGFLRGSDLADEVESVRFTPSSFSLEELSKLWSVIFQVRYSLSVAYQASVVLIEHEAPTRRVLPVRDLNVRAVTFRQPAIERITSQAGNGGPLSIGDTLVILGRHLRGDATKVRLGGALISPPEVEETQISVPLPPGANTLPSGSLEAGVNGVQVIHELNFGTPGDPHRGFESNVAAFVLRPRIPRDAAGNYRIRASTRLESNNTTKRGAVIVALRPIVGRQQRVVLLLNALRTAPGAPDVPRAYSFDADPRNTDRHVLRFPIRRVVPGDYLVRVQVDGGESSLDADPVQTSPTFDQYFEPKVTI